VREREREGEREYEGERVYERPRGGGERPRRGGGGEREREGERERAGERLTERPLGGGGEREREDGVRDRALSGVLGDALCDGGAYILLVCDEGPFAVSSSFNVVKSPFDERGVCAENSRR
jgi:hypothetical protein